MHNIVEIKTRAPSIVKDEKGRERTSNGRWSIPAMADYVASHPEGFHKAAALMRVANERVGPVRQEQRRKELSKIADYMINVLNLPAVVEWSGGKIIAVARYNPQNEYHQRLVAEEINRRTVRADGSAQRLEALIGLVPIPRFGTGA